HQRSAAQRVAGRLARFGGALLADATGLGKTYVALAVAGRFRHPTAVVPAALTTQWRRAAHVTRVHLKLVTHESLSRGGRLAGAGLVIVDEAHRFRNPTTRRYDTLARAVCGVPVLLVTATPVVNRPADIGALLRLFLADHALALLGVPSIEAAAAAQHDPALGHALSAVMVARSTKATGLDNLMPNARDGPLYADSTLTPDQLASVVQGIRRLAFPTLGDPAAGELMRMHLLLRLASSGPALEQTLVRHSRYLDHARAAAGRGQRVSRRALAALLATPDDGQLDLDLLRGSADVRIDARHLEAEAQRVAQLLDRVRAAQDLDPKAQRLCRALVDRQRDHPETKGIVFTTAVSTALHLARLLRWRRVVVATGRGARIASGPIGLTEALALFAPHGQHAAQPSSATRANLLIATDLVSEGLNLQDADLVVHYDLPWSPVRLAQRLGRVARLGSAHRQVDVWWFVPPAAAAEHLALAARLATKAETQLATGAPVTSTVGQAWLTGGLFDWRGGTTAASAPRPGIHAVVAAATGVVMALEWRVPGCPPLPELIVLDGEPPVQVSREAHLRCAVERLTAAPHSPAPPSAGLRSACLKAVRARLAAAQRGPHDPETRRLMRQVIRRARTAANQRRYGDLARLDQALESLSSGLPTGGLRRLADWLAAGFRGPALPTSPERNRLGAPVVALHAALFSDGLPSRPCESVVYSSRRNGARPAVGSRDLP
ncbi:MAG TPA: DEAD/DEAH box helicase, partial [Gemmatimonadales bacterium]|nr:DEAD/DEAH box helicase [Gemmatimonadales bacterium]